MAAQRMERWGTTDPRQAKVVAELVRTTERATRILNDLLDLTRSSFGTDIPIAKAKTDMAELCQTIADELRSINETQLIKVEPEGDPVGFWDAARMGQVLSNLGQRDPVQRFRQSCHSNDIRQGSPHGQMQYPQRAPFQMAYI